ncbi:hypothetical protein NDAWWUGD_CDS0006 [Salmonella phage SeKF_80]
MLPNIVNQFPFSKEPVLCLRYDLPSNADKNDKPSISDQYDIPSISVKMSSHQCFQSFQCKVVMFSS